MLASISILWSTPRIANKLVVVLYFILIWKASWNWRQPLLAFLISYWWNESRELNTKCSLTARSICRRHQKTVCCLSVRLSFDFSFGLVFRFFQHPPSLLLDQHSIRVFLSIMSYATGSTKQSPVFSTQCNLVRRHLFAFLTPLLCNIITSIIFSTIQTKIYSCSRCLFFGQNKNSFLKKLSKKLPWDWTSNMTMSGNFCFSVIHHSSD